LLYVYSICFKILYSQEHGHDPYRDEASASADCGGNGYDCKTCLHVQVVGFYNNPEMACVCMIEEGRTGCDGQGRDNRMQSQSRHQRKDDGRTGQQGYGCRTVGYGKQHSNEERHEYCGQRGLCDQVSEVGTNAGHSQYSTVGAGSAGCQDDETRSVNGFVEPIIYLFFAENAGIQEQSKDDTKGKGDDRMSDKA